MKIEKIEKEVEIPEGTTVAVAGRTVTAKGPEGEISRTWDSPKVKVAVEGNKIKLSVEKATNREKKAVFTLRAHIANILRGANEKHVYKLKICSGHFPMNVSISNGVISVKNYLGEKIPRTYKIRDGADVKVDGDIITVESADKEIAGDVAASIERTTRITNRDRRIFQDGIYIITKDGKELR